MESFKTLMKIEVVEQIRARNCSIYAQSIRASAYLKFVWFGRCSGVRFYRGRSSGQALVCFRAALYQGCGHAISTQTQVQTGAPHRAASPPPRSFGECFWWLTYVYYYSGHSCTVRWPMIRNYRQSSCRHGQQRRLPIAASWFRALSTRIRLDPSESQTTTPSTIAKKVMQHT